MTDKCSPKLGKVVTFGVADAEVIARIEEWLARFDSFPAYNTSRQPSPSIIEDLNSQFGCITKLWYPAARFGVCRNESVIEKGGVDIGMSRRHLVVYIAILVLSDILEAPSHGI